MADEENSNPKDLTIMKEESSSTDNNSNHNCSDIDQEYSNDTDKKKVKKKGIVFTNIFLTHVHIIYII